MSLVEISGVGSEGEAGPRRLSLDELVRDTLRARYEAEPHRDSAGKQPFRGSKIGYCLQQQMLLAWGAKPNIPDDKTLGVFEAGHALAAKYRKIFDEAGVLLKPPGYEDNPEVEWALSDDDWRIGFHLDFAIAGPGVPATGIELKSMGTKGVQYALDKGQSVAKEHQLLQAAAGSLLAAKTNFRPHGHELVRWIVLVEDKDKQTRHEAEVTQAHRDEVLRRLEILNKNYEDGSLPRCSCKTDWNGRFYQWCDFYNGNGACCSVAAERVG